MTREEMQRRCAERRQYAAALLEEAARAKAPVTHTEFARRLGISVQNFQTAKGMRGVVRKLRRHNARFKSAPTLTRDGSEPDIEGSARGVRDLLRRVMAEKESIRRDSEERIRQLMLKLDRLETQLEPAVFPLAAPGCSKPANDPFFEDEPEGACGVTVASATRMLQYAKMVPLAGLVVVRGSADPDRARPRLVDASTPVLELEFEDLEEEAEGARVADRADVLAALEFARGIRGHLVVHSWGGTGRAPAVALAIIAERLGRGKELEALASVLSIERHAMPNRLVVMHADRILNRDGALLAALDERINSHPEDRRNRAARRERILARLASIEITVPLTTV